MPTDAGFRGLAEPGPFSIDEDRRFGILDRQLQGIDPGQHGIDNARDPSRTAQLRNANFGVVDSLSFGHVVQALPTAHWYKVQMGRGGVSLACCSLLHGSPLAFGVRDAATLPPNSPVIVFRPATLPVGYIVGAIPKETVSATRRISDWWTQGGNSGLLNEEAYRFVLTMFGDGGVRDWNAHRPLDSTAFEWGQIAGTGIGVFVDSFQAWLRVNEACGLFLNYFDSHARLAGLQLDVQSYPRQMELRDDEGECQSVDSNLIYPWESQGFFAPGEELGVSHLAANGRPTANHGVYDLPDAAADQTPFARGVDYGGYLGQGWQRFLAAPPQSSGRHRLSVGAPPTGVFHEHVALDGSLSIRSAKSVTIGKRLLIPVPKRVKLREDETGDSARSGNYSASSVDGSQRVGDVAVSGDPLQRVAGVLDLMTYVQNWKGHHPFAYHAGDYIVPEESALGRSQEQLNFSVLSLGDAVPAPEPVFLRIDHRYGDVAYYARESFLTFQEDGSVVLGCGFGARIAFVDGKILIDAPNDVVVQAGKRMVTLAGEVVTRSHRSLDLSSANGDVRIKAEVNMQLLSGNAGIGGLLLENKATGVGHNYVGRFGEEVVDSGITLLSRFSEIGLLSGDILLRTGGSEFASGNITLDAQQGQREIVHTARNHLFFAENGVEIWHPTGDDQGFQSIEASHRFGREGSKIDGTLTIQNDVVVLEGSLLVKKDLLTDGNVVARGRMAQLGGGLLGDSQGVDFDPAFEINEEFRQGHLVTGQDVLESRLQQRWYSDGRLGSDAVLAAIGFSFRDPPGSRADQQYGTQFLRLLEPRWQQLVRAGGAVGGFVWQEPSVIYQGQPTYPWPGKKRWVDSPILTCYEGHRLYDVAAGRAVDRGEVYETPQLSDLRSRVAAEDYLTIL